MLPQIAPDETSEKFSEKMEALDIQAKEKETERAAVASGIPYINLKGFPISPEAIQLIDKQTAEKLSAVCFFYIGQEFRIGALDPLSVDVRELMGRIEEKIKARGAAYKISGQSLKYALGYYEKLPKIRPPAKGIAITADDLAKFGREMRSFTDLQSRIQGVSVTDIVALTIAAALQSGSSDIHIETEEKEIAIRFRIDGTLHLAAKIAKSDWPKIVSRLKLVSGLKINITDQPQDGRFTIFSQEGNVDVRVSTIPTAYGESVVMRLLRSTAAGFKFEDLGLAGRAFDQLKTEIQRPNGMIVTTGPTGSGKTTTLYAILNRVNNPETKIITLEDPVEYKLPGIAQSQVDASKNYTFASGLRSILRQDPDVIMIGEIRDLETADIAIQAALTGHLVLSTVHTNSASGAIPRFLALGAKPFLLAPSLNAVMAQRLVRKIHEDCKEEAQLDEETIKKVKEILGDKLPLQYKFCRGRGCEKCFGLGYKGRIGIYEVMIMNKEIEDVILSGKVSEYTLQEIAVKNGMITMAQDGLLKALDGITSVEEVLRVAE